MGCQQYWQQRLDREWHARHPDYEVERRLRRLRERLEQSKEPGEVVRQEEEPIRRLPAAEVKDALGTKGLAILVILGRLVSRPLQKEIEGGAEATQKPNSHRSAAQAAQSEETSGGQAGCWRERAEKPETRNYVTRKIL